MPHIHTKPGEHDHTASAYIFRTDGTEPRILLHVHKKLRVWLQFGGHIELDETPWECIKHEILEETGYDVKQLRILQPRERLKDTGVNTVLHPLPVAHNTHPIPKNHFHTDLAYAFVTTDDPAQPPASGESVTMKLFSRAELEKMPNDQIGAGTKKIALYIFDECLPHWEALSPDMFI